MCRGGNPPARGRRMVRRKAGRCMELSLSEGAIELARERGGVMALDFIPPIS